jgi:hypothetical protein
MTVLNHLAQVAAIILILELMVVLLIFLAVAGGLAFGLRWVNGKADTAFKQANEYTQKAAGYVRTGTGYAALPVIQVRRHAETVGATVQAVKQRVRQVGAVRAGGTSTPVPAEESETPVGAQPVRSG